MTAEYKPGDRVVYLGGDTRSTGRWNLWDTDTNQIIGCSSDDLTEVPVGTEGVVIDYRPGSERAVVIRWPMGVICMSTLYNYFDHVASLPTANIPLKVKRVLQL